VWGCGRDEFALATPLSLLNPHGVAVRSFVEDGVMHILMEYASGGTLYKRIVQQEGAFFPEPQIWEWFVQIVLALKCVHSRHVLHRDLKTQNIMLGGTSCSMIKLGDFGIAKVLGSEQQAATVVGTAVLPRDTCSFLLARCTCVAAPFRALSCWSPRRGGTAALLCGSLVVCWPLQLFLCTVCSRPTLLSIPARWARCSARVVFCGD
jgi:hypothetical protein